MTFDPKWQPAVTLGNLSDWKWFKKIIVQTLKVPGPISQNGNFYSNDASSPKKSWFQIAGKSVKPF